MKRYVIIAFSGIVGAALGYLLMCFLAWNFDPATWGQWTHPVWNGKDYVMKLDNSISGFLRWVGCLAMAGSSFGCGYAAWKLTKDTP
jgi:hypothetical protein